MVAQPAGAHGKCPVCGRPSEDRYKPFCSRRCADVDLARWLRGAYVIPDKVDSDSTGGEGPPDDPDDQERGPSR